MIGHQTRTVILILRSKVIIRSYFLIFAVLGFGIFLFFPTDTLASKLQFKEFAYHEKFKGKNDPFQFWTTNGKYTVNYKGLSSENGLAGDKVFKMDVTLDEGSYYYWAIPIGVPAEGDLHFTARIKLGRESTGRVGLGVNITLPPSTHSGCRPFRTFTSTNEKWEIVTGNVTAYGKDVAESGIRNVVWGADVNNVGYHLDRIVLFFYGNKGDRVIVYVDDITLSGEVADQIVYKEELAKRWAPVTLKFRKQISGWTDLLSRAKEEISAYPLLSPEYEKIRQAYIQLITIYEKKLHAYLERGFINNSEVREVTEYIEAVASNFKSIVDGKLLSRGYLIHTTKPISSIKILPNDPYIPGRIIDQIEINLCAGEYEPASLVLSALKNDLTIKVEAGEFKNNRGGLPANSVDIRTVKCWYQSGTAWTGIAQDLSRRILVPELLLKNDNLVEVNHDTKDNHILAHFASGPRYVGISQDGRDPSRKVIPLTDLPVRDTSSLLPVKISAGTNKQFWITVHVPLNTPPGMYKGVVRIISSNSKSQNIQLNINVLPFKLELPYHTSSIYYRGILDKTDQGSISSEIKNVKQFRKELENLLAHGVFNPTVYQPLDKNLLSQVLTIREEAGIVNQPLYYLGVVTGNPQSQDELNNLRRKVRETIKIANGFKITKVYFYGMDEAVGERLISQRRAWQMVRDEGGGIFVAGYKKEQFDKVGDLLDVFINAGYLSSGEAARWHSRTHQIWSYANPQGGLENPEIYRRNYGLQLWKASYDGACTYAYQDAWGNIWNDFEGDLYRGHNFTYPTTEGVIDTIAWEGYREGVDDIRYMTTLLKIIDLRKSDGYGNKESLVKAERFIREMDPINDTPENLRMKIIKNIMAIVN